MPAVFINPASTLVAGTKADVGTVAAPLVTAQAAREVVVQADKANTVDVILGSSSAQTFVLAAGQSVAIPIDDVGKIYARTPSATATVNWIAWR